MPSNAVTNAGSFKGSDYADSPGGRMVRSALGPLPRPGVLVDVCVFLLLTGSFGHVLAFWVTRAELQIKFGFDSPSLQITIL